MPRHLPPLVIDSSLPWAESLQTPSVQAMVQLLFLETHACMASSLKPRTDRRSSPQQPGRSSPLCSLPCRVSPCPCACLPLSPGLSTLVSSLPSCSSLQPPLPVIPLLLSCSWVAPNPLRQPHRAPDHIQNGPLSCV